MLVSAEIRWFWDRRPLLDEWFDGPDHPVPPGGDARRVDEYCILPDVKEVGIKRRDGKTDALEVKGLVADSCGEIAVSPFVGPLEMWVKYGLKIDVTGADWRRVEKKRRMRKFLDAEDGAREIALGPDELPLDGSVAPASGCNVEMTAIAVQEGCLWWSLGFEAFGPIDRLNANLTAAAAVLAERRPPELGAALRASYPLWLTQEAQLGNRKSVRPQA